MYTYNTLLIALIILLADAATDIYLPALPIISNFFYAGSSAAKGVSVHLTIAANIIGIGFSGLVYGAISDSVGRRRPMLYGVIIFIFGTLLCTRASSVIALIIYRFIQGFGQGVAVVVGFASVRDQYSGRQCAQILSRLSLITALSPAIGPMIGSAILKHSHDYWQYIFFNLSIPTSILFVLMFFFFKETLSHRQKMGSFKQISISYLSLIKNRGYMMYSSIVVLNFMWLWNVIAFMPFLTNHEGVCVMEGSWHMMVINVSGFIVGMLLNQHYVMRFGMRRLIVLGSIFPILTESMLIVLHYSNITLSAVILQSVWFFSAMGLAFVIGNGTTLVLDQVSKTESAKATALLVFSEMFVAGAAIPFSSHYQNGSIVTISLFTIFSVIVSLIIFGVQTLYFERKKATS